MIDLYHFTCAHGRDGIVKLGYVGPNYHPLLGIQIAWFVDMPDPTPDDVGLTSTILNCDRMAYRFRVDPELCRRWLGSIEQARTPTMVQADLHRFSTPEHWWISRVRVPVVGDL